MIAHRCHTSSYTRRKLYSLFVCLGLFLPIYGQPDAGHMDDGELETGGGAALTEVSRVKVYWENDGAFHDPFDGYDRHYTNGFAMVFDHRPAWAEQLLDVAPLSGMFDRRHGHVRAGAGYVLGQQIFTPENLTATAPIPTDRPYAGYLYGGAFWQRQGDWNRREDVSVLDHFEINLGLVGEESLGEDIQTWVHEHFQGEDPRGWDNQLETEVTAQLFFRRKWRIDLGGFDAPLVGPVDMQVIPQAGIALGTVHRHLDAAATFRVGQNLPDDFGPGRINDLQSATGDPLALQGWSWYLFGRAGGRVVEHDLFLDGSNYDTSLSVPKNALVGEVQGGFAVAYQPNAHHRFDLSWGLTYHTDTFDAPGATGTNSYGTLVLAWAFAY